MSLSVAEFIVIEPHFDDMTENQRLNYVFKKLCQDNNLNQVPYESLLSRMANLNSQYGSKFYFYRQPETCSLTGRQTEDKWYVTDKVEDISRFVRYDYRFISQVDQTDELCDLALRMNPAALLWINNPTVEQWRYMLENPSLVTSFESMRVPTDLYEECMNRVKTENKYFQQLGNNYQSNYHSGHQFVSYKKVNHRSQKRDASDVHYVHRRSNNPYQRTTYVVKPLKMTQQEKYLAKLLKNNDRSSLSDFKSLESYKQKAQWYNDLPKYSNFPCNLLVGNQRVKKSEKMHEIV